MSDPVTQAEIEDVLSSIRRLVSEDGRGAPATQPVQKPEKAKTRLVLTPALRVSSDDLEPRERLQPAEKPSAQSNADSPIVEDVADVISLDLDSVAAPAEEADTAVLEADLEVSPDATVGSELTDPERRQDLQAQNVQLTEQDDQDQDSLEQDDRDQGEGGQNQDDQVPAALDAENAEAPWRDPEATLFHTAAQLGEDTPTDSEIVADVPESDEVAETSEGGVAPVAAVSFVMEQAGEAPADNVVEPAESESPGAGGSAGVSAVVQKIAELEAKVGRSNEQWEPDGASRDPYAGTNIETLEWQDHLDEDPETDPEMQPAVTGQAGTSSDATVDDLVQEAVTDEAIDQIDNLAAEDSFLDEESLRELVAEIVRAELQGALGERITRNVRKLVRREIHRALSAQDLI